MVLDNHLYQSGYHCEWYGRIDDPLDEDSFRWHQAVKKFDLNQSDLSLMKPGKTNFGIIGFQCNEGVIRNLGRPGAALGPEYLRRELSNLAWNPQLNSGIFDCGNIACIENKLEEAQDELAKAVDLMMDAGLIPVVIGGGHDIAFGHFMGIRKNSSKQEKEPVGIISFDAHFDLRPYSEHNGNSGTMFRQIADICKIDNLPFNYYCVGIQGYANTKSLFKTADSLGVKYEMAKNISFSDIDEVKSRIDKFIKEQKQIYLTICADVFSSAHAPGVSAPQPFGMHPDIALELIKHVAASGKVISFDLAEVSPRFDEDKRTAKLGAVVIYAVINTICESFA